MNSEKFLNVLPIFIVGGGILIVFVWTIIARRSSKEKKGVLPLKSQRPDP